MVAGFVGASGASFTRTAGLASVDVGCEVSGAGAGAGAATGIAGVQVAVGAD